ncbi:hypothetical protein IAQ61_008661 [Plenodomus lingam]|nr:hypothetical protein IAQ61_008661 [Plenodomus lingam]
MKLQLHFLALTLAVTSAAAQNQTANPLAAILRLPACPLGCILQTSKNSTCAPTDVKCSCNNKVTQGLASACIMQKCSIQEALMAQNASAVTCKKPVGNLQTPYRIADITMLCISALFITTRIVYKLIFTIQDIWWDDYTLILTFALSIAGTVVSDLGSIPAGFGLDIWTLTLDQIASFAQLLWISALLYFIKLTFLRLSLLFFFARIFNRGITLQIIYATMAFNICFGIALTFALAFSCHPVDYFWTKYIDKSIPGKCVNSTAITWAHAVIGIVLDFWMLSIPLYKVWKLHLPLRKKLAITPMFMVGFAATMVAILRLRTIHRTTVSSLTNPTMNRVEINIWSIAEVSVGIICACMPTLRLMLFRMFPALSKDASTSNKYSSSNRPSKNTKGSSTKHSTNRKYGITCETSIDQEESYWKESEQRGSKDCVVVEGDGDGYGAADVNTDVGRDVDVVAVTAQHDRRGTDPGHSDDEVELLVLDEHGRAKFEP